MTSHRHLLDQVEWLATRGRRPRHADLKRATSTAYYALFHALAYQLANTLVGARHRDSAAWVRVYRALDHMKARQELKRLAPTLGPGALLQLATLFVELQELRHQADYEPGESRLTRVGVLAYQKLVDAVIEAFELISADEWREVATIILFKERR